LKDGSYLQGGGVESMGLPLCGLVLYGSRRGTRHKFFHRVANSHRKFNHVDSLNINGAMSKKPLEIKEHIVHFYNKLYFEQCSWRPRVDGVSFLSIDADEIIWLEREFEDEEVWDVVRHMNGDKAPGPNGFTMAFFQKCWEILKKDFFFFFFFGISFFFFKKGLMAVFA
jgi:hypothetical protein